MSVDATTWVFKHSPYEGDFRLVHLAIADVVNDDYDNECWLKTAGLAKKAKCSERTVQRAVKQMVEDGYIEVVERGGGRGKPSTYRFLKGDNLSPMERVTSATERVTSRPERVTSATSSPITNTSNSKNSSERQILTPDDAKKAYRAADNHERWAMPDPKDPTGTVTHSWDEHPSGFFNEDGTELEIPD